MTEEGGEAVQVAMLREMRRLRVSRGLAWYIAAATFLALRGPLREVDDKLCRLPLAMLRELPELVLARPA